jgi:hypothetical protein
MEDVCEEAAELVARVAALDVGKKELVACVRVPHDDKPGRRRQEVRAFATTTRSLLELRDWLVGEQVSLCVMEATSVYWKPPFYLLEDAVECWVVNARDAKNVPGRPKTDPLNELPVGFWRVCGQAVTWLATVARHDHWRGRAAGPGSAGGAAGGVA